MKTPGATSRDAGPATLLLAGVATLLLLAAPARGAEARDPAEPDNQQDVSGGRLLYRIYCVSCHGEEGRGDGPRAKTLHARPPDLTRLSRDQGGDFPAERVYRSIDGRDPVSAHGTREMPIWGLGLQDLDRDTNQETDVRDRIERLVEYLKTLQRPRGRSAAGD